MILAAPPPCYAGAVNKFGSFLAGAAVIAIAFVFVVSFRPASNVGMKGGVRCALEIRGNCISEGDYWATYRMLALRARDSERLKTMKLRTRAAEALVERWLLTEEAKRLSISVSEDEISEELFQGRARVSLPVADVQNLTYSLGLSPDLTIPLAVKSRDTNKFDSKQYNREVKMISHLSPEDFRAFQRQELLAARMRELIKSRVRVADSEARAQFDREKSTRTVDYVKFGKDFIKTTLDMDPKSVAAWAKEHSKDVDEAWEKRKSSFLPECRVVSHIVAKFDDKPKDETKKVIDRARKALLEGKKFAAVARAFSQDAAASKGGSLGCIQKGSWWKPFEEN